MGDGRVPELVSISISAWSLKARFALKHHAIKYRTTPYMPLFGELALRIRLRNFGTKVTVPVMFTPSDGVLYQSHDIAKWADEHTARPGAERLFPTGKEAEVSSWNTKSDAVLFFGRQSLVGAILADPAQLKEAVPPSLRWLGPLGVTLVRAIMWRVQSKYRAEASSTSIIKCLEVLREAQAVLRAQAGTGGGDGGGGSLTGRFLVGGALTYADVAMAVALSVVKPLGAPFASGPRPPLKEFQSYQEEFADMIAWRDAIFEKYWVDDRKKKN